MLFVVLFLLEGSRLDNCVVALRTRLQVLHPDVQRLP